MTISLAILIYAGGLAVGAGMAWSASRNAIAEARIEGFADGMDHGRSMAFFEIATGADARSPVETAARMTS